MSTLTVWELVLMWNGCLKIVVCSTYCVHLPNVVLRKGEDG